MSDVPNCLRIKEVLKRTGLSRATLYRRIGEKKFPAPAKDGACAVWPETAVAEYQRNILGIKPVSADVADLLG